MIPAAAEAVRLELAAFHRTELSDIDATLARQARRLTESTLDDLTRRLGRGGFTRYGRATSAQTRRAIREGLDAFSADFGTIIEEGQVRGVRVAEESLRRNLRRIGDGTAAESLRPIVTSDLIRGLSRERTDLVKGLTDDARLRVREAVYRATLTGETAGRVQADIGRELTQAEIERATARADLIPTAAAQARAAGEEILSPGVLGRIRGRAEAIARTEGLTPFSVAWQIGATEAAAVVPGLLKMWDAIDDARVRPDHIEAEAKYMANPIDVNARFVVGASHLLVPRDPTGYGDDLPGQRINCRCAAQLRPPEE